jgi:hypothetical protein
MELAVLVGLFFGGLVLWAVVKKVRGKKGAQPGGDVVDETPVNKR